MLCGAKDCQIRFGECWNRRPNAHEYKTQTKHERKNLSHRYPPFSRKTPTPLLLFAVNQRGAKKAATGDRAPDPVLSHESPGLDHGPSDGHARAARDLLPNNRQSIPRAHNEEPTNARPYTVS